MNLRILDWPDNEEELLPWLESQLMSHDLRSTVQQLEAFQLSSGGKPKPIAQEALTDILGSGLPVLLRSGLQGLDAATKQRLLGYVPGEPRVLLALQEIILRDGGDYWDRVQPLEASSKHTNLFSHSLSQLESESNPSPQSKLKTSDAQRRQLVALVALAATLLLGLTIWRLVSNNATQSFEGQFFSRRGLLDEQSSEAVFVTKVASSVRRDWRDFNGNFREKLIALRDSCDVLLAARLDQLAETKRNDLRERCKKWRVALTEYIEQLDSQGDVELIRKNAETTVENLIRAIEQLA